MRLTLLSLTVGAAFAMPLISTALADTANTLPERRAGLWEMKTVMDEGNGPRDQTMKMCIDGRMEKNTVSASIADHKSNCASYDIKADGGKTVVDSDCLYNGRKVVSTTNMSGDFKNAFEIKIESTTSDPTKSNQTTVIRRTITQLGKFLGESCGDLKPGEAMGTDGTRMVVQ